MIAGIPEIVEVVGSSAAKLIGFEEAYGAKEGRGSRCPGLLEN